MGQNVPPDTAEPHLRAAAKERMRASGGAVPQKSAEPAATRETRDAVAEKAAAASPPTTCA